MILPILFIVILTHEYQVFFLGIHFLISLGAVKQNNDLKEMHYRGGLLDFDDTLATTKSLVKYTIEFVGEKSEGVV